MSKYKVKVKDGEKEFEEEIEIDIKEQTETYRIPKTNSGNAGEVDVVYDFKKVKYFGQGKVGVKFNDLDWKFSQLDFNYSHNCLRTLSLSQISVYIGVVIWLYTCWFYSLFFP